MLESLKNFVYAALTDEHVIDTAVQVWLGLVALAHQRPLMAVWAPNSPLTAMRLAKLQAEWLGNR